MYALSKAYMLPILLVIVPRFRSRNLLRPVNRIKHVFDEQGGLVGGTVKLVRIIRTVDTPSLANTDDVETGSTVNGIFLNVEVVATSSAALPNVYLMVFKNPGGTFTPPAPNVVGASDLKKYSVHQEMVMLQEQTGSNPRTLFKGVIAFPRGYRRNGPNDLWQVSLLSPGNSMNYCVQAHYKEFR